jgi:hypothetical protein
MRSRDARLCHRRHSIFLYQSPKQSFNLRLTVHAYQLARANAMVRPLRHDRGRPCGGGFEYNRVVTRLELSHGGVLTA